MDKLKNQFQTLTQAGKIIYYESTNYHRIWRDVEMDIRYCPSLALKPPKNPTSSIKPFNPFLPPDPDMIVREAGPSHTIIFNKFSLIPLHLLVISNAFIHQDTLLVEEDFIACQTILKEWGDENWLFFYNSGPQSGASQSHKHLQAIPGITRIPTTRKGVFALADLICFQQLEDLTLNDWYSAYQKCCQQLAITSSSPSLSSSSSPPLALISYNLLFTNKWMLMVPRNCEHHNNISYNSLAMAGYLLAKDDHELDHLLHQVILDDLYLTIGCSNSTL